MSAPVEVFFFPNGNTVVCASGEQVPNLQRSWLLMFIEFLAENRVDPLTVKFNLPDGSVATVFETSEGNYNWRIESV